MGPIDCSFTVRGMCVRRLNLFAKGNIDVRDSLLYTRVDGTVQWNGINEIVRQKFPGYVVRIRHETWTRSDALLEAGATVPAELQAKKLSLEAYPIEAQFSRALLTTPSDAVVLSIQPDVVNCLLRHRRDQYLFFPRGLSNWPAQDRAWAQENFVPVGLLDVRSSMDQLARICREIRAHRNVPILVYNLSAVVPGESIHCHAGMEEILSTRIRRFNLALVELSQQIGVSIVDVDMIAARIGADRVKVDSIHLTAEGCRLVAEEVTAILQDVGCFDQTS